MPNIRRHIGVLDNGTRCYVVWNYLPDETNYCLVVEPDSLPEQYAIAVRDAVNGKGQQHKNLYNALEKEYMPSGTQMLSALHQGRFLRKVPTNTVTMLLSNEYSLKLSDLNVELIKEDLAEKQQIDAVSNVPTTTIADKLLTEGLSLIESGKAKVAQAYELRPDLKPTNNQADEAIDKADPNSLTFSFDKTMSQTHIVGLLKQFIKDNK